MTSRAKAPPARNYRKPKAVAVGFFYSGKGKRADVLRLEIDLKGVSQHDRARVVNRLMKLAEDYDFCR